MFSTFNRLVVGGLLLSFVCTNENLWAQKNNKQIHFNIIRPQGPLKTRVDFMNGQNQKSQEDMDQVNRELFKVITYPLTSSLKWATHNLANPLEEKTQDSAVILNEQIAPLFAFLERELRPQYKTIGNQKAQETHTFNQNFSMGSQNYSGFTWTLPMGHITLNVNRNLSPDLFDDKRYIVEDTLEITVDAQSFMGSMKESGQIDLSDQEMMLFAGMEFKRTYRTYNYAPDLISGLFFDFSKLFFAFLRFNNYGATHLDAYEILTQEDYFNGYAGGTATSPNYYGMTASVTGMMEYQRLAKVVMQSLGPDDQKNTNEFLRVSVEKDAGLKADMMAKLQGDFLSLLKVTLFYYNLSYDYKEAKKVYLSFTEKERVLLEQKNEHSRELNEFLGLLRFEPEKLGQYVVSLENREKENWSSKYGILIYANLKTSAAKLVHIQKAQDHRLFYQNHREATEIVENPWSKLISGVIKKLLKWDQAVMPDMKRSRFFDMEVSVNGADLKDEQVDEKLLHKNSSELSVSITSEFFARKTTGMVYEMYKDMALEFIEGNTNISHSVYQAVESNKLVGPLTLRASTRIQKDGINYFNQLSDNFLFYFLANICGALYAEWDDEEKRRKKSGLLLLDAQNRCVADLGNKAMSYREEYYSTQLIPVKKLKTFLLALHKQTARAEDFRNLFGENNVFTNGSFSAHNEGHLFQTYFQLGQFQGLGLINQYQRSH